jgi:hypothetical protein
MSELKPYFLSRNGRKLTYGVDAGRPGHAARRDYEIVPRGVDGDVLLATVAWLDSDRDGRKMPSSRREAAKPVRVPLRGLDGANEALEDAARLADPEWFAGRPTPRRGGGAAEAEALERRVATLADPEARGKDEAAPTPGSVARLRAFWTSVPNLAVPDVFSSATGDLRARWNHGHDRTLWVNFPEKGPLGWSVRLPRDGAPGFVTVNARCIDDQDIVQVAALLGVRCTKPGRG